MFAQDGGRRWGLRLRGRWPDIDRAHGAVFVLHDDLAPFRKGGRRKRDQEGQGQKIPHVYISKSGEV